MGGHQLRSPLDAGAWGAIYHLPDGAQHHALDSLGTVHTPDRLTLATSPTARPKPAPNHTDQGQGQCELIFRGSRQTDTDACARMWTRPLALQTCVHAHSTDVCAHEYVHECVHAHSTDVCARVHARPLYRRVCTSVCTPTLQTCVHMSVCTPTLQTCVHVSVARPLYRRVCT